MISLEEQLVKYYVIKHFLSLKIQNMMGINVDLLHWFIFDKRSLDGGVYLIKVLQVVVPKVKIC